MKITSRKSATYVPTWNGNRDLPEDEQVMVEIVFPTQGDREDLQPLSFREDGELFVKFSNAKAVSKHVKSVINLIDVVDGKEVKLETGLDLTKSTNVDMHHLIVELGAVISRNYGLDSEEKKSLK